MNQPISITAIASISPLGISQETIWQNYQSNNHFFTKRNGVYIAELPDDVRAEIRILQNSNDKYKLLDQSVLYAMYASRLAINSAQWSGLDNFGINMGSSRGATALFEKYHKGFIEQNRAETLSSPTTTLGNISSWVAHDLQTKGPTISHSITCSTALHALLNGIAWINSGMSDKFLVGGSEAPLTAFTIAQMQALKIYKREVNQEKQSRYSDFPNQALNLEKAENTMILGEAAAVVCLEKEHQDKAVAKIIGVGYATELLRHNASLSTNADCFQRSMNMALLDFNPEEVDIVITHTPGTIKGDQAEFNAIKKIFRNKLPKLTTNKWKIGHSLGASGMLSIEMAILMLKHQEFIPIPYLDLETPKKVNTILVNAVGFGGNAVSILLSK
ncbi:MAG: beta-ketoacyl synthase N-terminal-like domain-containing protein [Bacteroidota bacterium]